MSDKPTFIFEAPLFTMSGYGRWAMTLAKSLIRYNKYDCLFVPTRWGGCSRKHTLDNNIADPLEREVFNRILRQPLTKQPEVYMKCSISPEFKPIAKYNIGATAAIETSVASINWIEGLNNMNLNIVMSKHGKDVFEKATYTKNIPNQPPIPYKLEKPIEIVFWGADTDIFKKTDEKLSSIEEEFAKIPETFCFLSVGQWTSGGLFNDRKDIGNLIRVFLETFSNIKDKPALIIKTNGAAICTMDKYDMINRLKAIKDHVKEKTGSSNLPNVYIMYGNLKDEEMNALYNHEKVKVHISFTHGEGYGAPLLEASLSGKPILTSNWSGHLDFLNPNYCKLLEGKIAQIPGDAVNEWLISQAFWFNIDYQKAAETMKNIFYYYGSFLEGAEKLRLENMEKFSIKAMDVRLHSVFDQYIPQFAVERKLILPKLKKIESSSSTTTTSAPSINKLVLPKLKKIENINNIPKEKELPQIVLPKLKKITNDNPPTQEEITKMSTSENK